MPESNKLKSKLLQTLREEIDVLPSDLQGVLADDMITAFESRYAVLSKAKPDIEVTVNVESEVAQ